jgi:hypothetical protein
MLLHYGIDRYLGISANCRHCSIGIKAYVPKSITSAPNARSPTFRAASVPE